MKNLRLYPKFIVLLISVSLVPLVIVAGVTLLRFQQSLENEAEKLGHQLAATAAAEIRTFMISQFGLLDNIAAMYHPDFPIDPNIAEKLLEIILLRSENFMDIAVVDAEGSLIARKNRLLVISPKDLGVYENAAAFKAVQETGIYVGPVYVKSGRPFFDFGRRIPDSQGHFSGAVFAQVDARIMPSVVAEISKIVDSPGRVYIVNEHGTVIAHPDLSYVLKELDLSMLPPVHDITENPHAESVSATYVNEEGNRVLGSAHPMTIELYDLRDLKPSSINWFVVAEQPEASVYGEARRTAWFSVFLSLAAVLAAAGAAVFFAGRVSRPIEALHTATVEFGKGNLAYRAVVESTDEIGDLAQSFNTTADTLSKTVASLKAEEQITSAERNKLRLILSGITNAVVAVDMQRNIILFNRAAESLTGRHTTDVLGKPIADVIEIFDGSKKVPLDEFCPAKAPVVEGVVFSKRELRLHDTMGNERVVNVVSGRIREGDNIQLGCVLTFQDITREFVMERTKREFVSIAAHQLRTPLTGMSWTVEALLSEARGALNTAQKELVHLGLDTIHRMVDLVNDLLDVSRIEEGKFGIKAVPQPVAPILMQILQSLQKQADRKKIVLKADIATDLPDLALDADKIEFAFSNLIDNAIKYTPNGGEVHVRAEKKGSEVVVSVSDTGIGIPTVEYDRIFTKFFRSRKAQSYHTDGSGLGLYVAKNIVEQHGGTIAFTSTENQGTTFSIALKVPAR